MTDRELLELAAKAAGYDKTMEQIGVADSYGKWTNYVKNTTWINGIERRTYWDPLTDDGDALRLAVKLIEFEPYKSKGVTPWICLNEKDTRRAIVRAAAEIGKQMK